MPIVRYYDESKNHENATLPGVPLADLTDEVFDALPEWLQRSVDACDFYRKTKPQRETTAQPTAKAEKE